LKAKRRGGGRRAVDCVHDGSKLTVAKCKNVRLARHSRSLLAQFHCVAMAASPVRCTAIALFALTADRTAGAAGEELGERTFMLGSDPLGRQRLGE
jgi:hypothetical protein